MVVLALAHVEYRPSCPKYGEQQFILPFEPGEGLIVGCPNCETTIFATGTRELKPYTAVRHQ